MTVLERNNFHNLEGSDSPTLVYGHGQECLVLQHRHDTLAPVAEGEFVQAT